MSSENWPPKLKDWVAKCLGQMSDSNRAEAQAELRKVIANAYESKSLWTTDWDAVQLESLTPPPSSFLNALKRKSLESVPHGKKAKKAHITASKSVINLNDQSALNRRAERFQREHQIERIKHLHIDSVRASPSSTGIRSHRQTPDSESEIDVEKLRIVGTSTDLFKDYLRLTSDPQPEKIRPVHILQRTLTALKTRWREKVSYNWICSQLKSVRQDLTVQHVKNDFTVEVYEIHARIALESNDMVEYNACQASLKTLYEMGIPGKVEEFTAYRILMLIHGRNKSEMNYYIGQLNPQHKSSPAVRHAISVHRALSSSNYHALFELYLTAPHMGGYIMDHFIDRERIKALLVMTKAYMTLPLTFIQEELAFDSVPEAVKFLDDHSAAIFTEKTDAPKALDCKLAALALTQQFEDKYSKVSIKGRI